MPGSNELLALSDDERVEQDGSPVGVDLGTAAEMGGLALVSDSRDPQPDEIDAAPLEEQAFTRTLLGSLEKRNLTTAHAGSIAAGLVTLRSGVKGSEYRGTSNRAVSGSATPWEALITAVFENQPIAAIAKEYGYTFNTLNQYLGDFSRYLRKYYGGSAGVASALWELLEVEPDDQSAVTVPKPAKPTTTVTTSSSGGISLDVGTETFVRNNRGRKRREPLPIGKAALPSGFTPRDATERVFEPAPPDFGVEELDAVDAVAIFKEALELNDLGTKALTEFLATSAVPNGARRPPYEVKATVEALRQLLIETYGSLKSPKLHLQPLQQAALSKTLGWGAQVDRTVFTSPVSVYQYSLVQGLSNIDRIDAASTAYKRVALALEEKLAEASA